MVTPAELNRALLAERFGTRTPEYHPTDGERDAARSRLREQQNADAHNQQQQEAS